MFLAVGLIYRPGTSTLLLPLTVASYLIPGLWAGSLPVAWEWGVSIGVVSAVLGESVALLVRRVRRSEGHRAAAHASALASFERERVLNDTKEAFLESLSHEIRTPLSSILGYASTLERRHRELDERTREQLIAGLAANGRRLERLMADLIDLDRLETDVSRRSPYDLASIVEAASRSVDIGPRRLHLEIEPVVGDLAVRHLERIVEHLVRNAAKHTPEVASIWVALRATPEGALLIVENDGPNIPDAAKRPIFDPFRRGRDVPRHDPGAGVGLAIVRKLAGLGGGRAWVEDRSGGGASFRVALPRGDRHASQAGRDERDVDRADADTGRLEPLARR